MGSGGLPTMPTGSAGTRGSSVGFIARAAASMALLVAARAGVELKKREHDGLLVVAAVGTC